jgi:hypothetical protein
MAVGIQTLEGLTIHNWDSARNWPPFSALLQDLTGTGAIKHMAEFPCPNLIDNTASVYLHLLTHELSSI